MNRVPAPRHGYFDAVDERDAATRRCGVRCREAAGYVMIGQRENFKAAVGCPRNERFGRQGAVGMRRMAV